MPEPHNKRIPRDWCRTAEGIQAKGQELGVKTREGESAEHYKRRVLDAHDTAQLLPQQQAALEHIRENIQAPSDATPKQDAHDAPPPAESASGEAPKGPNAETNTKDEIPEPMPLPELPPVPRFPLDILPDAFRDWVDDAATRARFPADFAAVAAMVALGSIIGRKLGIRMKSRDDWTEYANVWGALVGSPAALKSPAMREAMRPLKALQVAANADFEALAANHKARVKAFRLAEDAIKKIAAKKLAEDPKATVDLTGPEEPEEPVARTYWTSNVNDASLGVLLAQNPDGLLIERDELSSLLVSLEDDSRADLRGMLLSGWSGNEGYRFDRIARGKIAIPRYALSVLGAIQPGPLSRYVRGAFRGERADGMLQRFQLLTWPDCEPFEYVDRPPNAKAKEAAWAVFERVDTMDADALGRRDFSSDPPFVRLCDEAQGVFAKWYTTFMCARHASEAAGSESAAMSAHFGKYPGLVAKLALILHVADADKGTNQVSVRTLLKALSWIEYLTPHARRVFYAAECPDTAAAKLLLVRVMAGALPHPFKAREVYRKGWHGLTDSDAVKRACRLLFDYGWLIEIDPGGPNGGRPADPLYAVSPRVEVSS